MPCILRHKRDYSLKSWELPESSPASALFFFFYLEARTASPFWANPSNTSPCSCFLLLWSSSLTPCWTTDQAGRSSEYHIAYGSLDSNTFKCLLLPSAQALTTWTAEQAICCKSCLLCEVTTDIHASLHLLMPPTYLKRLHSLLMSNPTFKFQDTNIRFPQSTH